MPQHADEPFAALGPSDRDELVQLAALLTADDSTDAGLLARRALVTAGRGRRRATAAELLAAARTELVREATGPSARAGGSAVGWGADSVSAADSDGFEVLRRELADLPAHTRAALVLDRWAGWTPSEIAAVLRAPTETVRTDVARGAATVRAVLHPASAYRRPVDTFVHSGTEREVREALDGLARSLASSATPLPPPEDLRREVRRARRRWWLIALAACCAAALVAVVVLAGGGGDDAGEGAEATASSSPSPRDVVIADLAPRGSLAGNAAFLAGLRDLPWVDDTGADHPVEFPTRRDSRRVLFAGDVPGARWALLVGEPEEVGADPDVVVYADELLMAWFVGPPDAAPEEMSMGSYPYGVSPDSVPALLDPRTGTLVVVAAPGDVVEVSPRVDVDADGKASRSWERVETDDGIAMARLEPINLPWTWSTTFRVRHERWQTITGSPDIVIAPFGEPQLGLDIRFPRPPSDEQRTVAEWTAGAAIAATGVSPEDVEITARALVPLPEPALGVLAVVTLEVPSGASVVSVQWARQDGESFSAGADCGLDILPAGQAPGTALLAAQCDLYDPETGNPLTPVLMVLAPPQVDRVRLYGGNTSFLGEHSVPDGGVVLIPLTVRPTEVEAVTAGGVLLGRTRPLGHWMPPN